MTLDEMRTIVDSGSHCINEVWAHNIKRLIAVADAAKRLRDNLFEFGTLTDNCFIERLDDAVAALERERRLPIRHNMNIGDLVRAKPGKDPLCCGSGTYPHAVVISLEPFVMVSEETDMRWSCYPVEDVEVFGKALPETVMKCERRLRD